MLLALSLLVSAQVDPLADYPRARTALNEQRQTLALHARREARESARRLLLDYFERSAFPAWEGTPWNFHGTTTTPREGTIACGYFVTTVFEQAGFRIDRVKLAQQASVWLVTTFARGSGVQWFRPKDNADAVRQLRARFGDGLLVIGFDYHVGLLRLEGERASFCHASFIEPGAVTCEDPVPSGAFASRAYVAADALNDAFLDDWLAGRKVPSRLPAPPE